MTLIDFAVEDRCGAIISETLDSLGIALTVGKDFREFEKYVAKARPNHPLGDPFDPDLREIACGNAIWIVGHDSDGEIVHLHAVKLLPMGTDSVAEYFRKNFLGFSPPELEIDKVRSRYRPCPSAKRMFGRVVYAGEFWVGMAPSRYRGVDLIGMLVKYAMLISIKELGADYFIGFVAKPQACKGLAMRFGFMHLDPFALRWYTPGKLDPLEGIMIYMSEEDMRYIMEIPPQDIDALAA